MHVSGFDLYYYHPLFQFLLTAFVIAIGLLYLVKSTASRYFAVDADFEQEGQGGGQVVVDNRRRPMIAVDGCAVCGNSGIKQCSRCKRVRYCSGACQSKHWTEGHKHKCRKLESVSSPRDSKSSEVYPQLKKVLFPYEEFVKLFNLENRFYSPCGLLNCGNSCYANVVLQCLSFTRPLVAYLLEIGHKRKCRRSDWCFLCALEIHVIKATSDRQPFSPINILSRLPNIGANLGYGKQEDAHEFMRFAIDTMQSVCLDEFGGERALHPTSQETTLIQYIFGGHLQSQVKCSKCNKISFRHENMMDLTVEIQGNADSLEECLNQFTAEEWLDGENMYKCDGCDDYVKACKRLAIHHAPNILTIALKRFQGGRFGKLNKRITFPETLDLSSYMSEPGDGTDFYQLYAVVVHIDMLNASYFGHYICYTKGSSGKWYSIDDCKVTTVELEEVLSQGAYMLLYSRMHVRSSCVNPEICKVEKQQVVEKAQPCSQSEVESSTIAGSNSKVTDVRSITEGPKQQGLNLAEEAQSCLLQPSEPITIGESTNSLNNMPHGVRSPTMASSEIGDPVCMNLDDTGEVNSRCTQEVSAAAPADGCKVEKQQVVEKAQPWSQSEVESSTIEGSNSKVTDVRSTTEGQKQQGLNLAEEAQSCLLQPSEPITIGESINSLNNMPSCVKSPTVVSSEISDPVCMNLDDTVEVNSRCTQQVSAATPADVNIDSISSSVDMDVDGPIRLDLIPTRGYQLDLDLESFGMKRSDCGNECFDATRRSSVQIFREGILTAVPLKEASSLVPLKEASSLAEAFGLDRELSSTIDDRHSFEDGNRSNESDFNEFSVDDSSLPSQSDIYTMAETSCSVPCSGLNSVTEILQEGNSSSFNSPADHTLEQTSTVMPVDVIPTAQILTSVPLKEASSLAEALGLDRELSGTIDDDHSFEDGNRSNESNFNEFLVDDSSLPSQSDICTVAETSCSVPYSGLNSVTKVLQEGNSSSFNSPADHTLESINTFMPVDVIPTVRITKTNISKCNRDKSCSKGKHRQLFSRGFLNESSRDSSSIRKGKNQVKKGDVGVSCKVSSNYNVNDFPCVSQNIRPVHECNGTLHSHGQDTPSLCNGKSEECLNGVELSDDCSSSSSPVVDIAPVKLVHGVPISAQLPKASLPTEVYDLGCEVEGPEFNVDLTSVMGNDCDLSGIKMGDSSAIQSEQELDEISSGVPVVPCADTEMLDESAQVNVIQSRECTTLFQIASAESGSIHAAQNMEASSPIMIDAPGLGEVGKVNNCNGFLNSVVSDIKAVRNMEALSSNIKMSDPCSVSSKPAFYPGFLNKQTRGKFQNRNDVRKGGEVGKVNTCNGSANSGSVLQKGRLANNYDRNLEHDNLLNGNGIIKKQCGKISMGEGETVVKALHKAGDVPQNHFSGHSSCKNYDGNKICNKNQGRKGKNIFSPGFLDKPSQKKCPKKDEEGPRPSEIVSTNHDRNKLPGFG